jgi:hypothetical protein
MSDDTETVTQTSQTTRTDPYGRAKPAIDNILSGVQGINPNLSGIERGALGGILGNANFLQQFGPQVQGLANQFLGGGRTGMVEDAYSNLQNNLAPTARGDFLDVANNPAMQGIANQVTNRVNAMYAGSGRDPSGAGSYGGNLAGALTDAFAPIYLGERQNQLGAINSLFGGAQSAGGLLSNMDQSNLQSGLSAAGSAQSIANDPFMQALSVESMRRGIPLEVLAAQAGIATPIGQAFGTTTGTGTQTQTMDVPWYQPVIGGAVAGAGLYGAFKK